MNILDILFPKRCVSCGKFGAYLCPDCFKKIEFLQNPVCPVCQRQAYLGKTHPGCAGKYRLDGLAVAARYGGPIKAAIQKVKYKHIFDIEKVFADLLSKRLQQFDLPKDIILVPVPLHPNRKRIRGFNQSEIMAKSLAKSIGVQFGDILERGCDTKTQVGLKRDQRRENVAGAFGLEDGADVRDKNILLVDDVYTSGATIQECCQVLKGAGAKTVWGMAVALG